MYISRCVCVRLIVHVVSIYKTRTHAQAFIYMCIDCRLACPRCMGLTLPRTAVSFNFNKWSKSCIVTVRSWRWEVLFFRACIALLIAYNHSFLNRGLAHTNTFLPPCKQQEKKAVRNTSAQRNINRKNKSTKHVLLWMWLVGSTVVWYDSGTMHSRCYRQKPTNHAYLSRRGRHCNHLKHGLVQLPIGCTGLQHIVQQNGVHRCAAFFRHDHNLAELAEVSGEESKRKQTNGVRGVGWNRYRR